MSYSKEEIRAIETLKENWHVVEKVLNADVLKASFELGSDPNMTETEIHFRRGAIFATRNFLQLADKLVMSAQSQMALDSQLTDDKGQRRT